MEEKEAIALAEQLVIYAFDNEAEEITLPVIVPSEGLVLFGKVTIKVDYSSLAICPSCKSASINNIDQNDLFECSDCGNRWTEENVNNVPAQDIIDGKNVNFHT